MPSQIDPTFPITGRSPGPTTLSVRNNFRIARDEISALQALIGTGGPGGGGVTQEQADLRYLRLLGGTVNGSIVVGPPTAPAGGVQSGDVNAVRLFENGVRVSTTVSGGGGTVTRVETGAGLTGGPITSSGTIAMANSGVTAGSYTNTNLTVDQQGRVTAASNGTPGGDGSSAFTTAVTINPSGVAMPAPPSNAVLQMTNPTDASFSTTMDGAGIAAVPYHRFRRAGGTLNNLQPLPNSMQIGFLEWAGYRPNATWGTGGNIHCVSTALWSDASNPTRMNFQTTRENANLPSIAMWIGSRGGVIIGSFGADQGPGALTAQKIFCSGDLEIDGQLIIQGMPHALGAELTDLVTQNEQLTRRVAELERNR